MCPAHQNLLNNFLKYHENTLKQEFLHNIKYIEHNNLNIKLLMNSLVDIFTYSTRGDCTLANTNYIFTLYHRKYAL